MRLKFSKDVDSVIRSTTIGSTVEEEWSLLKRVFTEVGKANIGTRKATAKKPWITHEIIQLIDERRQ